MGTVMLLDSRYAQLDQTMEQVFDFLALELKDKSVLLKPNLLWPSEPEQGLNTHPKVIQAAVNCCLKRGAAKVMVGDNAGQIMYGNSKQAFYGSGIGEVLGEYYVNLGIDLEPIHLKSLGRDVYISKLIRQADVVINLPKFKTHKLTGLTGAVKNTFGYLAGGQKARMHMIARSHQKFGEVLAEIHSIRKPDAAIMDAILGMQGNGASSPDLRYIGKLIASRDPVSLDAVQAEMMNMDPRGIIHLVEAEKLGLGTMAYSCTTKVVPLEGFLKAPGYADPAQLRETVTSEGLERDAAKMIPSVDKSKCTQCGACVAQCPVGYITMEQYPEIGCGECAGCHACQEICRSGAMYLG